MIDILTGFAMGSADAIDSRIVLTSNEMKSVNDTVMPDVYFAVNSNDGLLYVYKKGNPINKDTGKFRVVSKNDFNDSYKTKLDSLENYNDTELRGIINEKADKSHTHSQYATTESVEASINELRQLISAIEEQIRQ